MGLGNECLVDIRSIGGEGLADVQETDDVSEDSSCLVDLIKQSNYGLDEDIFVYEKRVNVHV